MCILWAYWSCQSWAEFQALIDAASRPTFRELMIVFGVLVLICICGMVWGRSSRETSEGRGTQASRRAISLLAFGDCSYGWRRYVFWLFRQ